MISISTLHIRAALVIPGALIGIALSVPGQADTVTDWNQELISAIRNTSQSPPKASRQLAMVHLAVFDAVNGIAKTHTPYLVATGAPAGASKHAAVSAAAKTVMDALYAGAGHANNEAVRASVLARHQSDLAAIPDGPPETDGVAWGIQVGNAILALRANDRSTEVVTYTETPAPGVWRPTPAGNAAALLPSWPLVTPFGLVSGNQFRPHQPPVLESAAYALEWAMTKDYGSATSTVRTADQTEIAHFWADGGGTETPPGHWMRIARTVSAAQNLTLEQNARLFALLGMSVADAAILCWDCKYDFNYWRPVTAIREADTDPNPGTTADPTWSPLIATPPFPEYTSGHSTFSRAAASILASVLGTDAINFSIGSDGLPNVTRSYAGFSAAADESGISRIFGGIHFQSANVAGQTTGARLAEFALENYLQPLGDLEFATLVKGSSSVEISFNVIPGRSYSLDASSDLTTWSRLAILNSATPTATYVDATPPEGKRFYKAELLP